MKEKNSHIRMPSKKPYPALYESLSSLQESGLSTDEIGRIYVNFLFENKSGRTLAHLRSTKGGAELEKVRRVIKKEIQKDTRHYFAEKANNLKYDGLKPEEIIPDPDPGTVQDMLNLFFGKSDTIEAVVNSLMDDRKRAYGRIGSALLQGAERYSQRKQAASSSNLYKLFLEYDGIHRAMKGRATEKTTTII